MDRPIHYESIAQKGLRKFWPFLIAVAVKALYIALPGHNHILGALTSIALLATLGQAFRHPPITALNSRFFTQTMPVLRLQIVVMYCWAAIQKMNWDYVTPEVSCASELHMEIMQYFPFIPNSQWELWVVSWISIGIELAIPALLLFPRTRRAGFVLAIFFHLWLSIHHAAGIFSFSALIMGMLVFFLPNPAAETIQATWTRHLEWLGKGNKARGENIVRFGLLFIFVPTVITQTALYLILGRDYETFWISNRVGFWMWATWGVWLASHYLVALWRTRDQSQRLPNRLVWTPALIMLIPVFMNGLNPWIGLKTQTSFSMYSNLRSEGEGNHMFLKRVDIFPFQKDMVEIVSSDPPLLRPSKNPGGIQQFANTGAILPYFELRRLVSNEEGDLEVVYSRDGELLTVMRRDGEVSGDEHLFEPLPWYLGKFLWFRRHESLTEPMHCTH